MTDDSSSSLSAAEGPARRWCFTLNNYTADEYLSVTEWKNIQYMVAGVEVGESGTKHLQGAVHWTVPKRFSAMRKLLKRAHWEKMISTGMEAFDYCKKDGDFIEVGEPVRQGQRTDITAVYKAVAERKSLRETAHANLLNYQAIRTFEILATLETPGLIFRNIHWIWGPTGTGKSRHAYEAGAHFMKRIGTFWTEYRGQTTVCLDDIRPFDITRAELLGITDIYPIQINVKGRMEWWWPDTVYITCPMDPETFWSEMHGTFSNDLKDQLIRRLKTVTKL